MNIRNNKAFTIIELIVVIAVIAILVSLGLPKVISYVNQAKLTRIQHDVKIMENKMEEVLSNDSKSWQTWDNNEKDLGALVLRKQLFEIQGVAKKVDFSFLNWQNGQMTAKALWLKNEVQIASIDELNTLGQPAMGGNLITTNNINENFDGYKIIPEKYHMQIGTRLKGTFYSNPIGKVYYEPDKQINANSNENSKPNCPVALPDYEFEHITGTIIKYNGKEQYLTIPHAFLVEDKCWPVKIIGTKAFARSVPPIYGVIIPPSVEKIEEEAFQDNQIEQIIIPPNIGEIKDNAFADNPLRGDGVVIQRHEGNKPIIGNNAFGNVNPQYKPPTDKNLGLNVQVNKGSNGKSTGSIKPGSSFNSNGSWGGISSNSSGGSNSNHSSSSSTGKTIVIPDTIIVNDEEVEIVEVDKGAFQGEGLIEVILPSGLERIEDYAFAGNQLIGVDVPEPVKHIGNYAFAYNEVFNGKDVKGTIDGIKIKGEEFSSKLNKKTGDLYNGGAKINNVKNASLLSHIFLTSIGNFVIPQDYNPSEILPEIIINDNQPALNNSVTTFNYKYDGIVLKEEWELNETITTSKPSKQFTEGTYTIKLRIMKEDEKWTNWIIKSFSVGRYENKIMNKVGSTTLESVEYEEGNDLTFNYTNNSNLNWIVPVSGLYKVDVWGAGAGGNGARVQGEIELIQGDVINFKIHSKGNGGGNGGAAKRGYKGESGKDGGGGTVVKLNNKNIVIGGGAGGNGGYGAGMPGVANSPGGKGGNGGNLSGLSGEKGSNGKAAQGYYSGGSGGQLSSDGGNAGSSPDRGDAGTRGPTVYDGGGGGSGAGMSGGSGRFAGGGGGGGAGGKSFIEETIIKNHKVTPGHNSGNGKVVLTLIKKH